MLYIKLFIEREKNTGQSAPECPFKAYCTTKHIIGHFEDDFTGQTTQPTCHRTEGQWSVPPSQLTTNITYETADL